MHKLLLRKVKACATTRMNRKLFPKNLKTIKKLKIGECKWMSTKTGLTAYVWQDKRLISFLSNYHSPLLVEKVLWRQKDGNRLEVRCPPVVRSYNQHMGYVDKGDMLKKCYEIS